MSGKKGRRGPSPISNFPAQLHKILSLPEFSHIISWMPHGRSWRVLKPKLFKEIVMLKYFSHQSKYSSFTRQVNAWNFRRITRGPDRFTYYHMFFIRDFPQEAMKMTRGVSDDTCESQFMMSDQSEHDFFKMNFLPQNSFGYGSNLPIRPPYPLSPPSNVVNNFMSYHRPNMQLPYYPNPPSRSYQEQMHSPVFQQPTPHHFRQQSNTSEVQYSANTGQYHTSTSDNEWRGKHPRQPSNRDDQYHSSTLDYKLPGKQISEKQSDRSMAPPRPIGDVKDEDGYSQHHGPYLIKDSQYCPNRSDDKWRSEFTRQTSNNNQLHKVTPDYTGIFSRQPSKDKQKPSLLSPISHEKLEFTSSTSSYDHYHKSERLTSSRSNYRRQESMSLFNPPDQEYCVRPTSHDTILSNQTDQDSGQDIWKDGKDAQIHHSNQTRILSPETYHLKVFRDNTSDQLPIIIEVPLQTSQESEAASYTEKAAKPIRLNLSFDKSNHYIEWNNSLLSIESGRDEKKFEDR